MKKQALEAIEALISMVAMSGNPVSFKVTEDLKGLAKKVKRVKNDNQDKAKDLVYAFVNNVGPFIDPQEGGKKSSFEIVSEIFDEGVEESDTDDGKDDDIITEDVISETTNVTDEGGELTIVDATIITEEE